MVEKYQSGIINNVVGFRELTRIARSQKAGVDRAHAIPAVIRLVRQKNYSIDQAYEDTVQAAYEQRDLTTRVNSIADRLSTMRRRGSLEPELRDAIEKLRKEIDRVLGN
jgi:hypothetical protein